MSKPKLTPERKTRVPRDCLRLANFGLPQVKYYNLIISIVLKKYYCKNYQAESSESLIQKRYFYQV